MANLENQNGSYIAHLDSVSTYVLDTGNDIRMALRPSIDAAEEAIIKARVDDVLSYVEPDAEWGSFSDRDLIWGESNGDYAGVFRSITNFPDQINLDPNTGGYDNGIPTHEFGHALGLAHPGETVGTSEDWNGSASNWQDSDSGITGPDGQSGLNIDDTMMQWGTRSTSSDGNGGQDYLQWMDVQALRAMHGMDTDGLTSVFMENGGDSFGINGQNDTNIWFANGDDTLDVRDGATTTIKAIGTGNDEITVEGEAQEFVFAKHGADLGIYDDDGTAVEFLAPNGEFDLTFSSFGNSDGAAGEESYGTVTVELGSFANTEGDIPDFKFQGSHILEADGDFSTLVGTQPQDDFALV